MLHQFSECLRQEYTHVDNDGSYALKREGAKLTIYFDGSYSTTDWKSNFDFPAKPYRDMQDKWFCHRGFLKVWKSIEPHIKVHIFDRSVSEIEVVGYSHGGAIAQLCYEYIKFNRPDIQVTGYGFGAPRVLWGFASKTVKKRFEGFVVVRNGRDIVTHLPPRLLGYKHICKIKRIGGKGIDSVLDHFRIAYLASLEREEIV